MFSRRSSVSSTLLSPVPSSVRTMAPSDSSWRSFEAEFGLRLRAEVCIGRQIVDAGRMCRHGSTAARLEPGFVVGPALCERKWGLGSFQTGRLGLT